MLRKTIFALSTAVALSAATLAPTSAFAGGGWHGGGWHGGGFGFGVGTAIGLGILAGAAYDNTCVVERVINTPYGPVVRRINVCY
jgi:uncharacterized membrane protein